MSFSQRDSAFDMYFASVCSMQYHPGAGTKEHRKLTVAECAEVALEMCAVRDKIINGDAVEGS